MTVLKYPNLTVLSDEIYSRMLYGGEHISIASLPGMRERTIVLDGFSKIYAMTGWRLGYGLFPREMVRRHHAAHGQQQLLHGDLHPDGGRHGAHRIAAAVGRYGGGVS